MKRKVAVLISTFNRLEYSKIMLWNYLKNTKLPHVLVLMDSGSKDGTAEWLKELEGSSMWGQYPHIMPRVVCCDENILLPGVKNLFYKMFLNDPDIEYLAHFADDVLVQDGELEELVRVMDKVPKMGLLIVRGLGIEHVKKLKEDNHPEYLCVDGEEFWNPGGLDGHSHQILRKQVIFSIRDNPLVANDGLIEPRGQAAPAFYCGFVRAAGWYVCHHPWLINREIQFDPVLSLDHTNKYEVYNAAMKIHFDKDSRPLNVDMYKGKTILKESV